MANELVTLAPGVHYFPGAVNQLVIEDGRGAALLIDSGLDESHAKKLLKAITARGLTLSAILSTHSHADHYGGNAFLESKFEDLKVFAPPLEEAILRTPILEPIYLFGARPPQELRGKFLMAKASNARLAPEPGLVKIAGVTLELIEVAGHASLMFAVRVGDVLFASDALFGPDSLTKHPLTFCMDSALQKESARKLGGLEGVRVVLPGHGEPTEDLAGLVAANLAAFERTTSAVKRAATTARTIDEILARVCDDLGVTMTNPGAVVLNRSVVSAHLVELVERGEAASRVEGNRWLWHAL
ncbi:MBL fold metallo-hydrolase [Deinococcus yavapaiensis]|uniref:Glyoxylase-like metal-dependent hydrolase (Beta-lactamase superfamily II) n=1 Tax=Deinococcus yavapaiensis KR-236 TaxID=694435 RepID=A0A318S609_9DEIO|nr:MBL fold metallo-hydrolase [Deinococcus yavapaiensis]PYE54222.1 glyoxylase-like metal-dependent hydrolase (beta-lactamase superfamily II) [Deinococcus yavapaiensis KR-236]